LDSAVSNIYFKHFVHTRDFSWHEDFPHTEPIVILKHNKCVKCHMFNMWFPL
jgi:hypothetical protein